MDKILLTSGCSWTDKNFMSTDLSISENERGGWPMWPELVAQKLKLQSVNTGKCGADNKYIFDSTVDNVYNNKNISMAIVMLSSWDRFVYMGKQKIPIGSLLISSHDYYKNRGEIYIPQPEFKDIFLNMTKDELRKYAIDIISTNLRYIHLLTEIFKLRKIPYLIFQGVPAFPIILVNEIKEMNASYKETTLIKDITSNQYFNSIKSNSNVIGYPFMKNINGYNLNHMLEENNYVSYLDRHPNKSGQEKIANHIMEIINARNIIL